MKESVKMPSRELYHAEGSIEKEKVYDQKHMNEKPPCKPAWSDRSLAEALGLIIRSGKPSKPWLTGHWSGPEKGHKHKEFHLKAPPRPLQGTPEHQLLYVWGLVSSQNTGKGQT